ncbi:MAG: nucleotidyltransferase [Clostridia bacterium]|nr:nucleotidyltransferase [Clostridia bacterium]
MSEVLGIVAEYNPFHNGHLYHIQKTKEQTGAKYVVCVMSGNFVQRGNTSIVDKWTKTQMALANGVDLVLELPTVYSVSSAENFAQGAVKILENLGIVDTISFGTETDDFAALNNIANILAEEPREYTTFLKEGLKQGESFPKAREEALIKYINDDKRYNDILKSPNNILGIEYLKALKKLKSNITPVAIKREKVYYNDDFIVDDLASATAIRKLMMNKDFAGLIKVVPRSCYEILTKEHEVGNVVYDLQRYEKEILYTLRRMTIDEIAELPDVTEGLEHSIKNAANYCNNINDFINIVKTRRYTQTRIQRILIFALLGITKKDIQSAKKVVPYARVLGFNQKGKMLLSGISQKNPKMEVVTSVKRFLDNNSNKTYKRMLEIDIFATDVYTLGYRYDSMANLDYTKNMIMM